MHCFINKLLNFTSLTADDDAIVRPRFPAGTALMFAARTRWQGRGSTIVIEDCLLRHAADDFKAVPVGNRLVTD